MMPLAVLRWFEKPFFSQHFPSFYCVFKEPFSERYKIVFGMNENELALFLTVALGLAALNWCRGLPAE
jgi:hypothetical protein